MNHSELASAILDLDRIAMDIDENYDSEVAIMVREVAKTLWNIRLCIECETTYWTSLLEKVREFEARDHRKYIEEKRLGL